MPRGLQKKAENQNIDYLAPIKNGPYLKQHGIKTEQSLIQMQVQVSVIKLLDLKVKIYP